MSDVRYRISKADFLRSPQLIYGQLLARWLEPRAPYWLGQRFVGVGWHVAGRKEVHYA